MSKEIEKKEGQKDLTDKEKLELMQKEKAELQKKLDEKEKELSNVEKLKIKEQEKAELLAQKKLIAEEKEIEELKKELNINDKKVTPNGEEDEIEDDSKDYILPEFQDEKQESKKEE